MSAHSLLRSTERFFWIVGGVLCGFCAGGYLITHYYQAVENHRLDAMLREAPSAPLVATRPHPRPAGSLVGRLEIPRLKLSAIVLEGDDDRTLRLGIGRVPQTADPGQRGNIVLGGHRDTFFRPLRAIRNGDRIKLVTPHGSFHYVVQWVQVVDPSDESSIRPTPGPALTLVTCYPFRYVGPAPRRFVVRARQEVY